MRRSTAAAYLKPATQQAPSASADTKTAAGHWAESAIAPAVTFLLAIWDIKVPSYWRDEAATISAVRRPLPALLRMLTNVDAVHGTY